MVCLPAAALLHSVFVHGTNLSEERQQKWQIRHLFSNRDNHKVIEHQNLFIACENHGHIITIS